MEQFGELEKRLFIQINSDEVTKDLNEEDGYDNEKLMLQEMSNRAQKRKDEIEVEI